MIHYHLPGLFEFTELYKVFLPLFKNHREWFYPWCDIASIYGSSSDCLWGGGRACSGDADPKEVIELARDFGFSPRLTFSNSLLRPEHLSDNLCNSLCNLFSDLPIPAGVIVHSELLTEYLVKNYPSLYLVSSTTKVLTDFDDFEAELNRKEFKYIVPDFRLNKQIEKLSSLNQTQKDKVEFLCNECCSINCRDRKACYENVSRRNLGEEVEEHKCKSPDAQGGYKFSLAMKNPSFISIEDIQNTYSPLGFTNFKLEGRGLGSAILLEFLLYYLTKAEHQIEVREAVYLDSMLDLF